MDVERMRELLATKCMGWTRKEGYTMSWYDDASGQDTGFYTVPEAIDPESDRRVWQPDRNKEQSVMVIEKMREDYLFQVVQNVWDVEGVYTVCFLRSGFKTAMVSGDFCYAVSLAAARALEQEPTNGQ